MFDFLMLALLTTAFVGALGYVRVCSVVVDQGDPRPDKAL
jgi:hypothetical protein